MNKTSLKHHLAKKHGLTQTQAKEIIDSIIEVQAQALLAGERVVLDGFGTYKVITKASRKGRNPRTGEDIHIPEQKTIKFKVAKVLKENLNK